MEDLVIHEDVLRPERSYATYCVFEREDRSKSRSVGIVIEPRATLLERARVRWAECYGAKAA